MTANGIPGGLPDATALFIYSSSAATLLILSGGMGIEAQEFNKKDAINTANIIIERFME